MTKTMVHTLAVGITGGIGSGKTDVCKIFEAFGARVLYADLIARNLINSHTDVQRQIKKTFGEKIYLPDGTLDRKHAAKLAFHDTDLHQNLNNIVHPYVLKEIEQEIAKEKEADRLPMLVVEAAILFEAHADELFDYVIVVDADEETRISRVMSRDGCDRGDVLARINAQMPVKEKVAMADFVIQNSGNKTSLKEKGTFMFHLLNRIAHIQQEKTG